MNRYWRWLQEPGKPGWHIWIAIVWGLLWATLFLVNLIPERDPDLYRYLLGSVGVFCGVGAEFLPASRGRLIGILRILAFLMIGISLLLLVFTWIR